MSEGSDVSVAREDEDYGVVVECLAFGDEFAADGCAACAYGADHLGVVVVESYDDWSFDFATDYGSHEFHRFLGCIGKAFGADLDGAVVVDVDRSAADNVPFVSGIEDHLAVLF